MQPGRSPLAAGLLVVLLPLTAWLWLSLLYLLQLEARNRLDGSPGESAPLYLALFGLPAVVLVSAWQPASRQGWRCGATRGPAYAGRWAPAPARGRGRCRRRRRTPGR